jgi:CDP-glycerol glycerophosphotransferase (TagB/SpsB family)
LKTILRRLSELGFVLMFRLCRLFPPRPGTVVCLQPNEQADSLRAMGEYLSHKGWRVFVMPVRCPGLRAKFQFYTIQTYRLATAGVVLLNDNFTPLRRLRFSRRAKVIQLWHAEGALKRFGLATDLPRRQRKVVARAARVYSAVVCSSEAVRKDYAEAFGVPLERVFALGSPRTDALVKRDDSLRARQAIEARYPQAKGKKIHLYAPTFRSGNSRCSRSDFPTAHDSATRVLFQKAQLLARFEGLGDRAITFVRLHPHVSANGHLGDSQATARGGSGHCPPRNGSGHCPPRGGSGHCPPCCPDITRERDVTDYLRACDVLLTDYSSICMDAVLLRKPVVCFCPDYAAYKRNPGFFADLKALPPGFVAETWEEALEALQAPPPQSEQARQAFVAHHLAACDGHSCEKLEQFIIHYE